jgi:hypothetical protein
MLHTKELDRISFAIFFLLVPILNQERCYFLHKTHNTTLWGVCNMSFVFVSPWWSLADFGATIKTSPLSSIVGGFLRLRRGNLSPTPGVCISWRRFDWQRSVLLQGGGFDQAHTVPKFSAAAPHLNKATLSSIVGGFFRLRWGNLSPTPGVCISWRRFAIWLATSGYISRRWVWSSARSPEILSCAIFATMSKEHESERDCLPQNHQCCEMPPQGQRSVIREYPTTWDLKRFWITGVN